MRVTKFSDLRSICKPSRDVANQGCNVCPCCGEVKTIFEWFEAGESEKGIMGGIQKEYSGSTTDGEHIYIDAYLCYTCGTEWESDPYRTRQKKM